MAVAGAAAAWPVAGQAQQQGVPAIGYLCPESLEPFASRIRAFREGLAKAGYVEGGNVAIEFRWAEGQYTRLPELAESLVRQQVAAIVAPGGAPVALADSRVHTRARGPATAATAPRRRTVPDAARLGSQ